MIPLLLSMLSVGTTPTYDLVVYGATPSGIAAAISFMNTSLKTTKSVALVEASNYLGGMSGPGGIGLRDFDTPSPCCTMLEWGMMNAKSYNVDYPVWQPDSAVGQYSFTNLLAKYKVDVFPGRPIQPGSIAVKDGKITSFATIGNTPTFFQGDTFIDATYEGLIMREVTSHTYGREAVSTYNESMAGVPPKKSPTFKHPINGYYTNTTIPLKYVSAKEELPVGSADLGVMGYSYRMCITNNPSNKVPFSRPNHYNESDFELMNRYVNSLSPPPSIHDLFGVLDYRNYPPKNKWDLCDAGGSPVTSDVVDETIEKYMMGSQEDQAQVAADVRYYVEGFLYWLANSDNSPNETKTSVNSYGPCLDQWSDNGCFPPQLYVRESLRMVGDHVFAQPEWQSGGYQNRSIGMGGWGIDIHVVHRRVNATTGIVYDEGWTNPGTGAHAFHLPVDLILPKRDTVQNLMVTSTPSCSHVTWACIREEPTLWLLGMAAGTIAGLSNGGAVQDFPINVLQKSLRDQGVAIPEQ